VKIEIKWLCNFKMRQVRVVVDLINLDS